MKARRPWLVRLMGPLVAGLLGACSGTCSGGGDPEVCRFEPIECGGGVGGFCDHPDQCESGFCCFGDHCARGLCTFPCRGDVDCPPDMACEHDTCLFACRSDGDCAPGQECRHDNTVCEYSH